MGQDTASGIVALLRPPPLYRKEAELDLDADRTIDKMEVVDRCKIGRRDSGWRSISKHLILSYYYT